MPSTEAGRRIGPYELSDEVGRGGMGVVYRTQQPGTGRDLAVKVIDESLSRSPAFLNRFAQEARTGSSLQHPHILPILETGVEKDQPYLVMPYMPGGTLVERIARSPGGLPVDEVVGITREVAAALDGAHQQGIIHCDVKPGNILFDAQGHAYLSDFGISRLGGDRRPLNGRPPGTPPYIAPEVAGGGEPTPASDIFALGVVVFEMLTGRKPNADDGDEHPYDRSPEARLRRWRSGAPGGMAVLVAQTLNADPDSRPVSAGLLADALALAARQVLPSQHLKPLEAPPADLNTDDSSEVRVIKASGPRTPPPEGIPAHIMTPPPDALAAHTSIPTPVSQSAPHRPRTPYPLISWMISVLLINLLLILFVFVMLSTGQ